LLEELHARERLADVGEVGRLLAVGGLVRRRVGRDRREAHDLVVARDGRERAPADRACVQAVLELERREAVAAELPALLDLFEEGARLLFGEAPRVDQDREEAHGLAALLALLADLELGVDLRLLARRLLDEE